MSLYLGIDLSTQSASGYAIDTKLGKAVWEYSLNFAKDLPEFGTTHGVISAPGGLVYSPPSMWVEALERLMAAFANSGLDLKQLKAIGGSGQQHGSVYVAPGWADALHHADDSRNLAEQLKPFYSRSISPVWMDSSTKLECEEISASGDLRAITGSAATLRFTGPQIRRFYKSEPDAYQNTRTVHLVSSFICSLLCGKSAPIDVADGSGMNLMDLSTHRWHHGLCEATAPGLLHKLPDVVSSRELVGELAPYWHKRYGLPAGVKINVFSGDNPCTLVGLGISEPGVAAISLGTSDTFFGLSDGIAVSPRGEGHIFASPTDGYMSLICYANGSLARENIRNSFDLDWPQFDAQVGQAPVGNHAQMILPYFSEEITPASGRAQVYKYGTADSSQAAQCRAIFESQMLSQKIHSRHCGDPQVIHVTGGASNSKALLQIMADVFNAEVKKLSTSSGAGLGAALRAYQADTNLDWGEVFEKFVSFDEQTFQPNALAHSVYADLLPIYEACEEHCLNQGPDPEHQRLDFIRRWK